MKGTHWTGLILSMGMGCVLKDSEGTTDSGSSAYEAVDSSTDAGEDDEGPESDPADTDDDESGAEGNLGGLDDGGSDDGGSDEGGSDDGGSDDGGTDDGGTGDGETGDGETDAETPEDEDAELVLPYGLNGTRIDPPTPLVDFYAVNRDGSSRSMVDLTDGPTVIWFYPAADTYG